MKVWIEVLFVTIAVSVVALFAALLITMAADSERRVHVNCDPNLTRDMQLREKYNDILPAE